MKVIRVLVDAMAFALGLSDVPPAASQRASRVLKSTSAMLQRNGQTFISKMLYQDLMLSSFNRYRWISRTSESQCTSTILRNFHVFRDGCSLKYNSMQGARGQQYIFASNRQSFSRVKILSLHHLIGTIVMQRG